MLANLERDHRSFEPSVATEVNAEQPLGVGQLLEVVLGASKYQGQEHQNDFISLFSIPF